MKTLTLSLLICAVMVAGLIPADAQAQSIFLEPNSGPGIHLEALRPSLNQYNFTTFSFSYYLSTTNQCRVLCTPDGTLIDINMYSGRDGATVYVVLEYTKTAD